MTKKPLLIYDGDCAFCAFWLMQWRRLTHDSVDFAKFQDVEHDYPDIPHEQFERGVQYITPDGRVYSNAQAVFRTLQHAPGHRWGLFCYRFLPAFALITELGYRIIASNRDAAYHVSHIIWGTSGPYSHVLIRWLYLRLLGIIYLIAFASMMPQIHGLIGSNGILPIASFLDVVGNFYNGDMLAAVNRVPTLLWLNHSDVMLTVLTVGGVVVSLLLIAGLVEFIALPLLWVMYLSIVSAGQVFLGFQWDSLLLEAGFLAIFLTSFRLFNRPSDADEPNYAVLWLHRLLIFKLMFMSGMVKLASGDPNWRNLRALDFHYYTQPLPTPLAWYMEQPPAWFQSFSTFSVFLIELAIPFLIFMPRRIRFFAAFSFIFFQVTILLTGNYTFFNWLTIVLCVPLLDDKLIARFFHPYASSRAGGILQNRSIPPLIRTLPVTVFALVMAIVSLAHITSRWNPQFQSDVRQSIRSLGGSYRINNPYGLFAVMTTSRPEIIIEGSHDGEIWEAYDFRYKPDDLNAAPPIVAPHQPRLDWQMWFAALGSVEGNRWFTRLAGQLMLDAPEVTRLFKHNPFEDDPPDFIRARLYSYEFTTIEEKRETGNWWKRELVGEYLSPVWLAEGVRESQGN